jgi:hypothetical protein
MRILSCKDAWFAMIVEQRARAQECITQEGLQSAAGTQMPCSCPSEAFPCTGNMEHTSLHMVSYFPV